MMKTKKSTYIFLIMIILVSLILNVLTIKPVYAVRNAENDLSNLTKYPTIYTLVRELQTAHPNWKFTILYTGLDWNSVIYNESLGHPDSPKSLVQTYVMEGNRNDWICPTCGDKKYDNGSWRCASEKTVAYYMDIRNWLDEETVFSMESLRYNADVHTVEGVKQILAGTFMDIDQIEYTDTSGNSQIIYKSYAQIIMEAGIANNISPYALASRVRQEQGSGGGSSLISGNYTGYIGYYNYFNVRASGNGEATIIQRGLKHAKDKGWTTPELSIHGGAEFLADEYINSYQDTLYLQKYSIDPAGGKLYAYQYMQNVSAPYTEGRSSRKAYVNSGKLESKFSFIVPVFENMPDLASPRPGRNIELVTDSVLVSTNTVPLTIRTGPSTSNSVAGKAPKGALITRIEKAEEPIDGIYWDKVAFEVGKEVVIGYATREYLTDATETQKFSEQKITTEMCNLRNGPGTTESKVKQVLPAGTGVTVIDKMNVTLDGHIWYKVVLENGTQGYVSSVYLQDGIVEKYKIEDGYVKVIPETTISDIPGAILNGDVFGTGAAITIDGTNYTLVVKGDSDGNGKIDSMDMYQIIQHILGSEILENERFYAVDTNADSKIDSMDMYNVIQIILSK